METNTVEKVEAVLKEKGCDVDAWERLRLAFSDYPHGDRPLTENEEYAFSRYVWIRDNCTTADLDLINNNIGKGCVAAGVKAPLFF